jgi:preprotein translocase subunit SecF
MAGGKKRRLILNDNIAEGDIHQAGDPTVTEQRMERNRARSIHQTSVHETMMKQSTLQVGRHIRARGTWAVAGAIILIIVVTAIKFHVW